MRNACCRGALLAGLFLAPGLALAADSTPQVIKIQGFLSDKTGGPAVPADGVFNMTFDLYDADPGGLLLATQGPLAVTVTDGLYQAELTMPVSVFTGGSSRFLEITVGSEVLTPRVRLVSTPFAYVADTLDGFDSVDLEESVEITDAVAAHDTDAAAHAIEIAGAVSSHDADGGAHATPIAGAVSSHDADGGAHTTQIAGAVSTHDASASAHATAIGDAVSTHAAATGVHTIEIAGAVSTHAADPSAHHPPTVDTSCDGADCDLRDSSLVSCDSVDTDAQGNLLCGTDATGGALTLVESFCFDADDMKAWEDSFASLEALDGANVDTGVRAFDRATVEYASAKLKVPGNADAAGNVTWRVIWEPRVAPATAAGVVWEVDHLALSSGDLRDAAYTNISLGTGGSGTSTGTLREFTGSTPLATLGWQGNQMVFLRLSRDGLEAGDDLDAAAATTDDDALLHMFCVEIPRQ